MAQWFLKVGDKESGPGTEQQLRSAFKKGAIREDSLVRREDQTQWVSFKESGLLEAKGDNPFIDKNSPSYRSRESRHGRQERPLIHADMFQEKPKYKVGSSLKYATFVDRFMAIFIDGIIMMIVSVFVAFIPVLGMIAQIALGFGYFVVLQSEWGYTIGRKVMGIHIALENGAKPQMKDLVVRYFAGIVSAFFLLLGYFLALTDDRMRTFHDRMAATVVVKD